MTNRQLYGRRHEAADWLTYRQVNIHWTFVQSGYRHILM
jgi:hypothetical protein